MFGYIASRIRYLYYKKVRRYSDVDITIMNMRKSGITVGENCRIFTSIRAAEPYLIHIGNNVTISSSVSFCTHDNAIIKVIDQKTDVVGKIVVGDNCFIGMNSILMYGVTLGDNCIVGAGSVVTHSFPPHTVVAGNPARAICTSEQYALKYMDVAINFKGMSYDEKRAYILEHSELWVQR